MNAVERRLTELRTMREACSALRAHADPAARALAETLLARIDRNEAMLRELLADTHYAVERWETPALWDEVLAGLEAADDEEAPR